MALTIQHKTKYDWAAMWLQFLAGATHEELVETFGVPMATLVKYSREHFWSQRRKKALEVASISVKRDLARRIEQRRASHQHFMLDQLEETEGHIKQMSTQDSKTSSIERKLAAMDKHDTITRRVTGMDKAEAEDATKLGLTLLTMLSGGARPTLVNETPEPAEITDIEATVTPKKEEDQTPLNEQNEGSPLPYPSEGETDPFPGILRSLNAHPMVPEHPENDQNQDQIEEPGTNGTASHESNGVEFKTLPDRIQF